MEWLPISDSHESLVRELMECRGIVGAAAVRRLVEIKGAAIKNELLELLFEVRQDYNFCVFGIGQALRDFASPDDVEKILIIGESLNNGRAPDEDDGFVAGAVSFLGKIDLTTIRERLLPKNRSEPLSPFRISVLCDLLWNHHSTAALDLSAELLDRGVDDVGYAIYAISNFGEPENRLDWSSFSRAHVHRLIQSLDSGRRHAWALSGLRCICEARVDLAEIVRSACSEKSGIMRAALLWCTDTRETTAFFDALAQLEHMDTRKRRKQPINLLDEITLNWEGHEALYVRLLRLRDTRLALALLGSSNPLKFVIGELEIGELSWWLQWLKDEENSRDGFWLRLQMASLFASRLTSPARRGFLTEFNRAESPFRQILAREILPCFSDVTTDMFTDDAISFLLADISHRGSCSGIRGHVLGTAATEVFVMERLLPLIPEAKDPLSENIRKVLREAGSRHGRRYIPS